MRKREKSRARETHKRRWGEKMKGYIYGTSKHRTAKSPPSVECARREIAVCAFTVWRLGPFAGAEYN